MPTFTNCQLKSNLEYLSHSFELITETDPRILPSCLSKEDFEKLKEMRREIDRMTTLVDYSKNTRSEIAVQVPIRASAPQAGNFSIYNR